MKEITINGVIINNNQQKFYDYKGIDAVCPKLVIEQLEKANGEDVRILINSSGGLVFSGHEIFTALKNYSGHVETVVTGHAASSASIILLGGDTVKASPGAQIMIHNVSSVKKGDYRDMEREKMALEGASDGLAFIYSQKTGLPMDEIRKMMDEETWLSAQKAKEKGFIDEILFDNSVHLVANNGYVVSQKEIDAFYNSLEEKGEEAPTVSPFAKYCPKSSPFRKFIKK